MNTQAILPVLLFFSRNKGILDPRALAATLLMDQCQLQMLVAEAEFNGRLLTAINDSQYLALLQIGEQLGVIHKGTEFEIVPLQSELTVAEYYRADDPKSLKYAQDWSAENLGKELHKRGLITFEIVPWQQVRQRHPGEKEWQMKAKLTALKEK